MTEVRMARLDEVLSTDRLGQLVMTVGSVAAMEDRAGWDLGQLVRTTSYHEGLGYGGSCTGSCKGYGHARRGHYIDLPGSAMQAVALSNHNIIDLTKFGCVFGTSEDSGPALNRAFNTYRARAAANNTIFGTVNQVCVDGRHGIYRSDESLNLCRVNGFGHTLQDFCIYSQATGKVAMDVIGSRGGIMRNVRCVGSQALPPRHGIRFARSSEAGFGFCDSWLLEKVDTLGFFTGIAFVQYGQESAHLDQCRFWNYHKDGRVAVYVGTDETITEVSIPSDFITVITGNVSFVQNTYTSLDMRALPFQRVYPVSNVSNTNPAVVTFTLGARVVPEVGDAIAFGIPTGGMTEITNKRYVITAVNGDGTIDIDVDATGFGTFTGDVDMYLANTLSPVVWSRGKQHDFHGSYIVSYGTTALLIYLAGQGVDKCNFDLLFEGHGQNTHISIRDVDEPNSEFADCKISTHNQRAELAFITHDGTGANTLDFLNCNIQANRFHQAIISPSNRPLFTGASVGRVRILNTEIGTGDPNLTTSAFHTFQGTLSLRGSGETIVSGVSLQNVTVDGEPPLTDADLDVNGGAVITGVRVDVSGTISITAQTGTFGGVTINNAIQKVFGKTVHLYLDVTIDDVGTATGYIQVTLPENYDITCGGAIGAGRRGPNMVQGRLINSNQIHIRNYDNTSPIAAGALLYSMTYELA